MPIAAPAILDGLKKHAPLIAFSVSWTPDPNFVWDGDGPDPADEGYEAHDVDVFARAVVEGELMEGRDSLGGAYERPGSFDPDIHGYLPQMFQEAVDELAKLVSGATLKQAKAASRYLTRVLQARFKEQEGPRSR